MGDLIRLTRDSTGQNRLLNRLELHKSGRNQGILDSTLPEIGPQIAGWIAGLDDPKRSETMLTAFNQTLLQKYCFMWPSAVKINRN